jgi:hypothetical protein
MAGLVADYNSDSEDENTGDSSSESDDTSSEDEEPEEEINEPQEKLPLPDILNEKAQNSELNSLKIADHSASVFFNPFKAKEDEKLAILERHVKLTERKDETKKEKAKFRRSKNAQKFPRRQNHNEQNGGDDSGFNAKAFEKRKRRVGVGDSLIPPKKALRAYEKQRRDEAPRK